MTATGFHHVAFACRDINATHRFYEDLMGFPLVHTEMTNFDEGFFRHVFFDLGDGTCMAFFDLHGVGEAPDWQSEISTANGLPVWVNHVAFGATSEKQAEVGARMAAEGIEPVMDIDHGWCHSVYYLDPNGILVELCRDTPGFDPEPERAKSLLDAVPT